MSVRKTDVAWDPRLVRVEYLDERGEPYYCEFEERASLLENVASGIATCPAPLSVNQSVSRRAESAMRSGLPSAP